MASLTPKPDGTEDESFIILGTSPGTSLDLKCNGMDTPSLDRGALADAMKDLPEEASSAFKAHFKLNEGPSMASLMVASSLITDDKSTEELQKQFGELLDENVILKETLKKNNESMKEQFLMIASCQEDMMKTHMIHKEKFDETRELVEKLRQENKKLKSDIARLADSEPHKSNDTTSSGPLSALEFVTSPDDDTINKLTAQLELVEKQRRQVIVENEKLTWQKESLETIVDATSKERDDLKEKIKNIEMQQSSIESDYIHKINLQNNTILDLNTKLDSATNSMSILSTSELTKRDETIRQLDEKITALRNDLKHAQLKLLESESVKLEFSKYKSGVLDTVKMYKDQIIDLQNRLKEAQTTVFQPVRFSISSEPDNTSSEYATFMANVKLYDKTLKHIAELLNLVTHGSVDSLVQCLGVVSSLLDFKLERSNVDQFKSSLADLKQTLEKQHNTALSNIGQIRGTLTIFEGIFKDHNELLKKAVKKTEVTKQAPPPPNVDQLTSALVARGQELQTLQSEIAALKAHKEDADLLKAQLDLYKSDFEAERESREKMASEKENILADLRTTQKRNQELLMQLEEVRKLNPLVYRNATFKPKPTGPAGSQGSTGSQGQGHGQGQGQTGTRRQSAPGTTTGNMGQRQRHGYDYPPSPPDDDCTVM
ncbi:hypothetical protein O0L34_g7488 [Tuta absoluta]|nr:hypothetical protein O0L34_g7488 [Tuta absoluta]